MEQEDSARPLPRPAVGRPGGGSVDAVDSLRSNRARLDRALPRRGGSLAERLHVWKLAHRLPEVERFPALVYKAIAETRARTYALVPLPEENRGL